MTISIPTWLLWTLAVLIGVPAFVALLALAWFGYVALTAVGGAFWK